ncbi:NAC domain-containing protein [Heracleum sosnowskyi]|uniref:NAC domain-containing protein n=1 Tax=Heracleum sosnowskyi TaxID=360622 RepID=A0AAD8HU23_9APIA|nr:NAC domain-containing protein [Heracleum sosnowskyi]
MEESIDKKLQTLEYSSLKEEENNSNVSDIVVVGNDSRIDTKNIGRQAAVRINENDDIECLPGYRFNPFDHELLVHYLWKKVKKQPLPHNKITEVELYKYNPEDITQVEQGLVDKEWYFFTPRDRKYKNGTRPNRAAGNGYWKATGADKDVKYKGVLVGHRKALVFYHGKAPKGDKTNWIMHEFRVTEEQSKDQKIRKGDNDMRLDDWVLCRIYKKDDRIRRAPKQNHAENAFHNSFELSSPSNQNAAATTRNDINETGGDFCHEIGGNPQMMIGNGHRNIPGSHSLLMMNNTHYSHYPDNSMHNPFLSNPLPYSNPQPFRYISPSFPSNYNLENLTYLENSFEDWGSTGHYPLVDNPFLDSSPNDAIILQSNTNNALPNNSENNIIISENNSEIVTSSNDNSSS